MSDEIAWLREVLGAGTSGPWMDNGAGMVVAPESNADTMVVHGYVAETPHTCSADATAIVLAHNVGAELLAVVEAAERLHSAIANARAWSALGATGDLWTALDALRAKVRALREGGR